MRATLRRAALCIALLTMGAPVWPATLGPFPVRPVVALYLVGDGEPCDGNVVVRQAGPSKADRFLVRVLDAEEQLSVWRYVEYTDPATVAEFGAREELDLRPTTAVPGDGEVVLEIPFVVGGEGVHQIRISSGSNALTVEVDIERDLAWGLCAQNSDFMPWPGQPATLYAHVPSKAELLQLRGGPVVVQHELGADVAAHGDGGGSTDIPVERTGAEWRFTFPEPDSWKLRAAGFPLILCPTEEAARAIGASVETLPDGTVVCHKFQRHIADLLPGLLSPERVGATDDLVVPLSSRKEAWLAEPERNLVLMDSFLPMIEHWLTQQNLDAASHWAGSLDGWQDRVALAPPEGRWDRLRGIEGLYAGASSHYGAGAEHLALAATYDHPVNPYFGRQELLYRAAAAALRDLMALAEDETWPGSADLDPYPGMMAFCLGQKTLPVYGIAAPHMPQEIRDVWTEGLRHLVDRSFPDSLVTCRNQSSHYLVAFQAFADGSGDPLYQDLARLYSRRWRAGQSPTGYHMECIGPCSSYIGMTHWHEAVYYRMSGDPVVLDSLRDSYGLFNHTVGPEPDGRMLGGFNFNHRVAEGFYLEQWSGAKGILDDVLPEIGVWAAPRPDGEEREQAIARITLRRARSLGGLPLPGSRPVHPRLQ